jgi:hypothetical protein
MRGVLCLDRLEPRIFTRRLIEVAVDADEAVHQSRIIPPREWWREYERRMQNAEVRIQKYEKSQRHTTRRLWSVIG